MKKYLLVFCALLLAIPATAAEVETIFGAGIGQEVGPTGEAFNIATTGVRVKTWENGASIWTTLNYGQYVEENIDALGGSLWLACPWWAAKDPDNLVKGVSILVDVGAFSKIRDAGDGDRALGFHVGAGLDFQLTDILHMQVTGKAFNTGPQQKLTKVALLTFAVSPKFIIGGAK